MGLSQWAGFESITTDEDIIENLNITGQTTMNVAGFSGQHSKFVIRDSYMERLQSGITAQISSVENIEFNNCDIDTIQIMGDTGVLKILNAYNGDVGRYVIDLNGHNIISLNLTGFFDLTYTPPQVPYSFLTNSASAGSTIGILSWVGYYQGTGGTNVLWTSGTGTITIVSYGTIAVTFQLSYIPGFPFGLEIAGPQYGFGTGAYSDVAALLISPNPPGTGAIQNMNQVSIDVYLPVTFAASTASTLKTYVGPQNPPTSLVVNDSEPAAITGTVVRTYRIKVPINWWFMCAVTGTGTSLGTAVLMPA